MNARALLAAFAAVAMPAQDDVVVHCVLPRAAVEAVREHLDDRLAGTARVLVTARATAELVADLRLGGGVLPVDVVFGLDSCWLAQLAAEGALMAYASPAAATLAPQYRTERFVVPMLSPWRLAFAAPSPLGQDDGSPKDHDELVHGGGLRGELVLCEPRALPSLFAGWMLRETRGNGEEYALAWLRTLDAKVHSYQRDPGAVLAALAADRSLVTILPLCEAMARGTDLLTVRDVAPGLPWLGLGLALGRRGHAEATAAARAVYDELAGATLAGPSSGLLPAPREPAPREPASLPSSRAAATTLPPSRGTGEAFAADPAAGAFDPRAVPLERWLALWETEVRGRGAHSATVELVLEAVFGAAFLAFLWFVWRRVRTES